MQETQPTARSFTFWGMGLHKPTFIELLLAVALASALCALMFAPYPELPAARRAGFVGLASVGGLLGFMGLTVLKGWKQALIAVGAMLLACVFGEVSWTWLSHLAG